MWMSLSTSNQYKTSLSTMCKVIFGYVFTVEVVICASFSLLDNFWTLENCNCTPEILNTARYFCVWNCDLRSNKKVGLVIDVTPTEGHFTGMDGHTPDNAIASSIHTVWSRCHILPWIFIWHWLFNHEIFFFVWFLFLGKDKTTAPAVNTRLWCGCCLYYTSILCCARKTAEIS